MTYAQGQMDERSRWLRLVEQQYQRLEKDRGYNWRKALETLAAEGWKGTQEIPFEEEPEPVVVEQK